MNGHEGNLDNILHRTESSDWVAAVLGLENHPITSMLSGHSDGTKRKKEHLCIHFLILYIFDDLNIDGSYSRIYMSSFMIFYSTIS